MDVSTRKQEYKNNSQYVTFCNDIYKGTPTAKQYLQQFLRESKQKYEERKDLCSLDNFAKRTVNGLRNIIFRKPIDTQNINNQLLQRYLEKIDLKISINDFARQLAVNLIKDGKTYILAENYSMEGIETKAQEIQASIRPYLVNITRDNLINWRKNDDGTYQWAIIREGYSVYDGFNETKKDRYLVYYPDRVDVYEDNQRAKTFNTNIGIVPLIELGSNDIPEIYDLCKLNVVHLNRNSELDYYIRQSSAPIPVTYQMGNDSGEVVTIGVNDGINFSAPKGEAGFEWVSIKAENTEAIEKRINKLEEQMLNIAVTFATSTKIKTATQVDTEKTEDESKLVTVANELESGLNEAIRLLSLYDTSLATEDKILVNKDFDSNMLTPEEWNGYRQDYINGVISWETYIKMLIKGEVYPLMDDKQLETEKALLRDSGNL